MIRALLFATIAATALGGCVANDDRPRPSSYNPPGWIDRDRDGIDDRDQGERNPRYNPPGWIDPDRDGIDDRYERRPGRGYYDRLGVWHWY